MAYGDDRLVGKLQGGIWPVVFWAILVCMALLLVVTQLYSSQLMRVFGSGIIAWFAAFNLRKAIAAYRATTKSLDR